MRILTASDHAILVEAADLDEAMRLNLAWDGIPGVVERIPGARTVLVRFDPLRVSAADLAAVRAAFTKYAVLVFPDQHFEDDTQLAFARYFGPLETTVFKARQNHKLRLHENLADVGNLDAENRILETSDRHRLYNLGNRLWHTDSSFKRLPAYCSMLHARSIPPLGGQTEFADMRAAYDALPEATKRRIAGLVAEHSIWHSRGQLGVTKYTPDELASLPPVPQRVVRTHPGSKRKTLYVAAHASHVLGMPVADGRLLLLDLMEHATQRQYVRAHTWKQGDLVIWDNRCTMHRARPFDTSQVRDLRRVTTADVASTLEQAA